MQAPSGYILTALRTIVHISVAKFWIASQPSTSDDAPPCQGGMPPGALIPSALKHPGLAVGAAFASVSYFEGPGYCRIRFCALDQECPDAGRTAADRAWG